MAEYALLISGVFSGRTVVADAKPPDIPHKAVTWLPFVRSAAPAFDPVTQVLLGPTVTVLADSVVSAYAVRQKTQTELDTDKQAYVYSVDMLVFKVLFNHENRVRALESKAAITSQQFKTALLGML